MVGYVFQAEFYVMYFSGIVGGIGGSIGMFLGFSLWKCARHFLKVISVH